jgi:hypothetical protein
VGNFIDVRSKQANKQASKQMAVDGILRHVILQGVGRDVWTSCLREKCTSINVKPFRSETICSSANFLGTLCYSAENVYEFMTTYKFIKYTLWSQGVSSGMNIVKTCGINLKINAKHMRK